jgi:hypothetical protein
MNWLGRYARAVDHVATNNVAQGTPLEDGSTLHPRKSYPKNHESKK